VKKRNRPRISKKSKKLADGTPSGEPAGYDTRVSRFGADEGAEAVEELLAGTKIHFFA